jgi:hypothetical protein
MSDTTTAPINAQTLSNNGNGPAMNSFTTYSNSSEGPFTASGTIHTNSNPGNSVFQDHGTASAAGNTFQVDNSSTINTNHSETQSTVLLSDTTNNIYGSSHQVYITSASGVTNFVNNDSTLGGGVYHVNTGPT